MHKPVTYLHETKTNHNPKSLGSHNLKPHDRTVLTTTPHNLSYPSFMITLKLNFRGIAYLPASFTRELNRVISTRQTWQSVDI